ncbi:ribonuclease J [Anaerorhabdus sp.]|jgi:ribonuclease J|uniref:ribonuclease J n=1 Tax=Anaerorhabdus sp. TaxID=1872524 RepID=UPI002B200CA7|nr:ribonuclease J [Anaerorhabdus sp.]MEA4875137.1 ribonuclease J [Anaerorhabdus sp.]
MNTVKIFALGGLDEDGKNMYCVEVNNSIFVMEAGLKYPENEQLGIEMIIPDFKYLVDNADRVKAIFISHGHDDVMAALPNLLKLINVPIYTAPLTASILEKRFKKENITNAKIHRIQRNANFKIDGINIRTFGVTQSIADGFGIAIETEKGYVVYTSEFIIDYDTQNDAFKTDITQFTDLSKKGVLALLAESVGSTRIGHSAPQHRITSLIEQEFENAEGRIVITMYHQNLYRIIEVIELANKYGRKIMFYDDALRELLKDVENLGYYHIPAGLELPKSKFNQDLENIVVLISGDGANIFKRVHKIAIKEDELLEFRPSDTIIIASPAVPGTEREATKMENDLYKEGARVCAVDSKRMFSMHAAIEDLKMMMYLLKPKYYIPVKGEYRQLVANANIALDMGYTADKILVLDNGQIAEFQEGRLTKSSDFIKLEDVFVDGKENLDATGMVLKDRETLSTDGAIVVGIVINHKTKEVIGGPDIQSRGVIYLKDADYIMKEVGNILENCINDAVRENRYENMTCRMEARDRISKYVLKETGKKPMILPAIVEINTTE